MSASANLRSGTKIRVASETVVAKSAELTSQALLFLLVPRALGPSGYGQFAPAFGAVSIVAIALGLGAPLAAIRYVPASHPGERLSTARAVAEHVMRSRAGLLTAISVVATVVAIVVPRAPVGLIVAICASSWFSVGSTILSELALAIGLPRVWNARFPLENLLVLGCAIGGDAAFGISGAIVGIAVATSVTFCALGVFVVPHLAGASPGQTLPAGASSYARFETASVIVTTVILRGSPLGMVLLGAAKAQVGYAAIATGVGAAAAGVVLSLFSVQLPRLSDIARADLPQAESEARNYTLLVLAVAVLPAVPIAIYATPILRVVLGHGFVGARDALVIALAAAPLTVAIGLGGQVAHLRLRPSILAFAWSCGGLTFIAVGAAAVPGQGSRGAALAVVAALAAAAVVAVALLRDRALRAPALIAIAGAATLLGVGWAAAPLW